MIQSKITNICDNFICQDTAKVDGYSYYLFIDAAGQAFIRKQLDVDDDTMTARFYKKPSATTIEDFWTNKTTYTYTYFHLI